MSILKKLFGSSAKAAEPIPVTIYKDFKITPDPVKDGTVFRIAATIEKTFDGTDKVHHLIRADTLNSREQAIDASVAKAQLVIDQLGDRLFR